MRYLDFMVFYPMANFRRKKMDVIMWGRQLSTAVFLASLNVSLQIIILVEISCFLIFRIAIFDVHRFELMMAAGAILNAFLFDYIYINKKRYEYITSAQFKPFKLGITFGVTVCFLIFIASLIASIGIPLAIDALLKK